MKEKNQLIWRNRFTLLHIQVFSFSLAYEKDMLKKQVNDAGINYNLLDYLTSISVFLSV